MPSLQILEGLIGTACAVACLYYTRRGSLAPQAESSAPAVPWHSALGEYARRNPFAAFFGALAFGFLASSWSMNVSPRAYALPAPHPVEKWHVVTKNVPTPDPAQTARIAALQTTIDANAATIASQKAEIDRLKQLAGKSAIARSNARHASASRPATTASADTATRTVDSKETSTAAGGTTAVQNASIVPNANATVAANPPPPQAAQGSVTAAGNSSVAAPNAAEQNSASAVPH